SAGIMLADGMVIQKLQAKASIVSLGADREVHLLPSAHIIAQPVAKMLIIACGQVQTDTGLGQEAEALLLIQPEGQQAGTQTVAVFIVYLVGGGQSIGSIQIQTGLPVSQGIVQVTGKIPGIGAGLH